VKRYFKEHETIPPTEVSFYKIGRVLGKGAFGKVNLAMHKFASKLVAIKSINRKYLHQDDAQSKIDAEINIMTRL
jgi:5'-AMP-activated protein kinase catalytic alpha subunit